MKHLSDYTDADLAALAQADVARAHARTHGKGARRRGLGHAEAGGHEDALAAGGVLGYDEAATCPEGLAGWVGLARHPSRLLGPLTRFLPPDMASIFVFVCRRT
jgi:hypothetical protein